MLNVDWTWKSLSERTENNMKSVKCADVHQYINIGRLWKKKKEAGKKKLPWGKKQTNKQKPKPP